MRSKALANPARARNRYNEMPRKRKLSENQNGTPNGAVAGNGSAEQAAPKKKPAPRRKSIAKKTVTKPAAENIEATTSSNVSDEAIRVRAYHIAEERARRGLPGDENSDWLEARRQLMAERS
jgi:hypothetical protein